MTRKAGARCPGCGKPAASPQWLPFCSERCKMADLGHWFSGRYSIPADNESEPPEDPEPPRQ